MTFREAAGKYIEAHSASWRNLKTLQQWQQSLADYAFPALGNLPVAAIDVGLVMKAIEPSMGNQDRDGQSSPPAHRGRIGLVNDARLPDRRQPGKMGGSSGKPVAEAQQGSEVEHFKALPYAEIAGFMVELRRQPASLPGA